MSVPHPFPYQGSKRMLAWAITACLPADMERLIEPFCGSAALSIVSADHAAAHKVARRFVLNDINAPLMDLWRAIIETPDLIAEQYRTLWAAQAGQEKQFYFQIRDEFNRACRPDHLLYLLARCVKAAIRYNAQGEFNQSPDNRRKGMQPDTMARNLQDVSALLRNRAILSAGDYRSIVQTALSQDVLYLDPPYQGVCHKRDPRYLNRVSFDSFVEVLDDLNTKAMSFIVSYDGRSGSKSFGNTLPASLKLTHFQIPAGRSAQATLLGRTDQTCESLYMSPVLLERLSGVPANLRLYRV